jgi:hypothetical protein
MSTTRRALTNWGSPITAPSKVQPTLNLLPGATAKTFNFDLVSGSNMKPTDMHIHAVKYTIVDKNHIISEWQGWMDGKPANKPKKFDLHRMTA